MSDIDTIDLGNPSFKYVRCTLLEDVDRVAKIGVAVVKREPCRPGVEVADLSLEAEMSSIGGSVVGGCK